VTTTVFFLNVLAFSFYTGIKGAYIPIIAVGCTPTTILFEGVLTFVVYTGINCAMVIVITV